VIFFFLPISLWAQWTETFDGASLDSAWKGQHAVWQQKNGHLQSNGPAQSGTCLRLSRATELGDSFELQALSSLNMATSSNNYLSFILQGKNKYWRVKLGGTPDEVSLYEENTLLIDGADKTLASSSINPMGIRLRVSSGMAELAICLGNDTLNWLVQGTAILDSFSVDSLLIEACYSSSNAASFYLEDIRIGNILYDKTAPFVLRHYKVGQAWHLFFSEAMDTATGQALPFFGDSIAYFWANSRQLILPVFLGDTLLDLQDFKDQNGNALLEPNIRLKDPRLTFRSIHISELMADPNPTAGLPEQEWIELFNGSPDDIEMNSCQLQDATSNALFPDYSFQSGAYLLLAANCSLLTQYGPCLELAISSSLLNNSGDELLLIHRNGDTLENLHYSNSWYKDALKSDGGYSLEKRDPFNACVPDKVNFVASKDAQGGSPGRINSVDERIRDEIPPVLQLFELLGPKMARLIFTEALSNLGAVFFQSDSLKLERVDEAEYRLIFKNALPADARKIWHICLENQQDCAGNRSTDTCFEFRFAIPEIPHRAELIFTELFYLPSMHYSPFVEVYNRSEKALSLAGTSWGNESKMLIFGNQLLYPGESLVLCKKADTMQLTGLKKELFSTWPVFSSSGKVWLQNVEGERIDQAYFADSLFVGASGNTGAYSLVRIDSLHRCARKQDWQTGICLGGSPGIQNFQKGQGADALPELWQVYPISPSRLRLSYSSALGPELPDIELNASGNLLRWDISGMDFSNGEIEWSENLLPNTRYRLTQAAGQTCNGEEFPEQSFEFQLPSGAEGLRLNEILFDPIGNEPDYVELYNAGDKAIDLKGIFLGKQDEQGIIKEKGLIAPEGYLLLPGEYVLITEREHLLAKRYPGFSGRNSLFMKGLPSYPNTGAGVLLMDSTGVVLDSFFYTPSMHSSLLDETEGVSLERIDPNYVGDQISNWISASASTNFGTPGRVNSQYRSSTSKITKHWSLASASFSPDGDGFEDQAVIRYEGLEPGSSASISLHALSGAIITEWANNLPLGVNGQLLWEGIDGFGIPIANGPYLLLISWTSPSGKRQTQRLILVKAAKN